MAFQDINFTVTHRVLIYDGFFQGSTEIMVFVKGLSSGHTLFIYDEDTAEVLGDKIISGLNVSEYQTIPLNAPLQSKRIIGFMDTFGTKTAGGIAVLEYQENPTGWLTPGLVNEEAIPEDIGLYNPALTPPLSAKYDASLKNNIPQAYRNKALEFAAFQPSFDIKTTFKVNPTTEITEAIVEILNIQRTRGAYTVNWAVSDTNGSNTVETTGGEIRTFTGDHLIHILIEDSQGFYAEKAFEIRPETEYMPVAPSAPPTTIEMYILRAIQTNNGYLVRGDARNPLPLEISYNGGSSYQDMSQSGTTEWGSLKDGLLPIPCTVVIRVKSNPADSVTKTIPVPFP